MGAAEPTEAHEADQRTRGDDQEHDPETRALGQAPH